jgi:hypothetical protein
VQKLFKQSHQEEDDDDDQSSGERPPKEPLKNFKMMVPDVLVVPMPGMQALHNVSKGSDEHPS